MTRGYHLVQGDMTTCGGRILEGTTDHTLSGKAVACDRDKVSCGKHPGVFMIAGGAGNIFVHGRMMAGTLDSVSTCPCHARFIPSMMQDTYECTGASSAERCHSEKVNTEKTDDVMSDNSAVSQPAVPDADGESPDSAFRGNYDVRRGDLIYGLATERARYIMELYPKYKIDSKAFPPLVIDVYNNNVSAAITMANDIKVLTGLARKPEKYIRKLVVPDNLVESVRQYRDGPDHLWREYFHPGETNPKFNIKSVYEEVARNYQKDEYHEVFTEMPAVMGVVPKLLWKRGSKLGIEMTAQNASHHLHFVLDGLSVPDIVEKKPPYGMSVTASELRYAYRNRHRLVGKIYFYRDKLSVPAPWESEPELWQRYNPKPVTAIVAGGGSAQVTGRKSWRKRLSQFFKVKQRNMPG